MEAGHRPPEPDLSERITRRAYRFDFFQLVYLLEHWIRVPEGAEAPLSVQTAVGHAGPLAEEGLRLRPVPQLVFAPADVRRLEWLPARPEEADEDEGAARWDDPTLFERRGKAIYAPGEVARIDVSFMGLYGTSAPGPLYFSELLNDPMVEEIAHLRSFLDLFNHRMLSFYYRAWQKYRYPYSYEPGAKDQFSAHVLSFSGLRDEEARAQTRLHAPRLIKYTGLLSMRTRPLAGLRRLLADYFRHLLTDAEATAIARGEIEDPGERRLANTALDRVRLRSWMLRWVEIPAEEQNRIGERNCQLGHDLTLGEATPNRSGKFRVRLGPLTYSAYQAWLPGGEPFRELSALTRLWIGERLDFDFEMVLRRQDVPEAQLGGSVQLGWTGWITSSPGIDHDPSILFPKQNLHSSYERAQ